MTPSSQPGNLLRPIWSRWDASPSSGSHWSSCAHWPSFSRQHQGVPGTLQPPQLGWEGPQSGSHAYTSQGHTLSLSPAHQQCTLLSTARPHTLTALLPAPCSWGHSLVRTSTPCSRDNVPLLSTARLLRLQDPCCTPRPLPLEEGSICWNFFI